MTVTAARVKDMFVPPASGESSRRRYYDIMGDERNRKDLAELGHKLWFPPITHVCHLIDILERTSAKHGKMGAAKLINYIHHIPKVSDTDPPATIVKTLNDYFSKTIEERTAPIEADIKRFAETTDVEELQKSIDAYMDCQYYHLIYLRNLLADMIVDPKVLPHSQEAWPNHPVWKVYPVTLSAGIVPGESSDRDYGKYLISSNDISGLLLKLKSIYMRAAYLQLIQTLSQLAEKKSYQSVTFRQDELSAVINQIAQLSNDTYRQIMNEDKYISRICAKIIKIIDPNATEESIIKHFNTLGTDNTVGYGFFKTSVDKHS